jgi:hypothetical protein
MAGRDDTLESVQEHLKLALERYRDKARVRGDFVEAVFGMHHGLLRAFDIMLRDSNLLKQKPDASFADKAEAALPDFYVRYRVSTLAEQRNYYAHPEHNFYHQVTDDSIRETAIGFVNLVLDAWPKLFNTSPPYASIEHPPLTRQENILSAPQVAELQADIVALQIELSNAKSKDRRIQELDEEVARLKAKLRPRLPIPRIPDLPWRKLGIGMLLLLPLPLLIGFGLHLVVTMPGSWAWPVVVGLAALILCFLGLLNLARFLRAVGLVRLVAIISIVLVIVTLVFLPATDAELGWARRAGSSLTLCLDSVGGAVLSYTTTCVDWGSDLATLMASPSTGVTVPIPESTRSTTPGASKTPGATITATPRPGWTPGPTATSTE